MNDALCLGDISYRPSLARRWGTAIIGGAIITVLVGAGAGAYGVISPGGSTAWREPGAIILTKDSASRSVYVDGQLHPVLNKTSAMLIGGQASHVVSVSSASLDGVRRGVALGIPGAPELPPAVSDLTQQSWGACLPPPGSSGALVLDGQDPVQPMPRDELVQVFSTTGQPWVLWDGQRFAVTDPLVQVVLGVESRSASVAPDSWLDALPRGVDLAPAEVDGAGEPGPVIGEEVLPLGAVAQYTAPNGELDTWLVLSDGLARTSATEDALARAAGASVVELTAATVATAPASATDLVSRVPDLVGARALDATQTTPCLDQVAVPVTGPNGQTTIRVDSRLGTAPSAQLGDQNTTGAATRVRFQPTGGMLITTAGDDRAWLLTDQGERHVLGAGAADALGYRSVQAVPLPTDVVEGLRTGPALDRGDALLPEREDG